jgi:Zn-dependent protease with chaperone function
MIVFNANYFDGITSRAHPVEIRFDGKFLGIRGKIDFIQKTIPIEECRITPPLGRASRIIALPDNMQCVTDDFDAIRLIEQQTAKNRGMRLVNFLETRWRIVLACFAGLIVCVWAFIVFGIPIIAKQVAYTIPPEVMETVSQKTLTFLDKQFFKPTELPDERRAEIQTLFDQTIQEFDPNYNFRIILRHSPQIGPNAFALPSGIILVTDELVELSEDEKELQGVLIHEIGHIENRHGMRSVLQHTGVFLLISALVGDVVSITSTAASLPMLLVETGYSRKFEMEADQAVQHYFHRYNQPTTPFQLMLERLSKAHPQPKGMSFISTHPETEERIKYLKQMDSEKFP